MAGDNRRGGEGITGSNRNVRHRYLQYLGLQPQPRSLPTSASGEKVPEGVTYPPNLLQPIFYLSWGLLKSLKVNTSPSCLFLVRNLKDQIRKVTISSTAHCPATGGEKRLSVSQLGDILCQGHSKSTSHSKHNSIVQNYLDLKAMS